MRILQAVFTGIFFIAFTVVSAAGKGIDLTGTYSSLKSTAASGDIVGEEIRVLHFDVPEGYWIIYQCAEGEVSEPVFVEAAVKGPKTLEFTVPEGRLCANTYTAIFTSKGVTLMQSMFKKPLMKVEP